MKWWPVLLMVPLTTAGVLFAQGVATSPATQAPFATLSEGDLGTTTTGASATSATVNISLLPAVIPDDALDITSSNASWQVHAELVSKTGFDGVLDTVTLALDDGGLVETQITIVAGSTTQDKGLPVDLPTSGTTELTAVGIGSGTLELVLVLEPDGGSGPALRYPVTINV